MIRSDTNIDFGQLLTALDEQIGLLEGRRLLMADLSKALVRRDDDVTETLLASIEQAEAQQKAADLRLH